MINLYNIMGVLSSGYWPYQPNTHINLIQPMWEVGLYYGPYIGNEIITRLLLLNVIFSSVVKKRVKKED